MAQFTVCLYFARLQAYLPHELINVCVGLLAVDFAVQWVQDCCLFCFVIEQLGLGQGDFRLKVLLAVQR